MRLPPVRTWVSVVPPAYSQRKFRPFCRTFTPPRANHSEVSSFAVSQLAVETMPVLESMLRARHRPLERFFHSYPVLPGRYYSCV